jgi:hypothetical protein
VNRTKTSQDVVSEFCESYVRMFRCASAGDTARAQSIAIDIDQQSRSAFYLYGEGAGALKADGLARARAICDASGVPTW